MPTGLSLRGSAASVCVAAALFLVPPLVLISQTPAERAQFEWIQREIDRLLGKLILDREAESRNRAALAQAESALNEALRLNDLQSIPIARQAVAVARKGLADAQRVRQLNEERLAQFQRTRNWRLGTKDFAVNGIIRGLVYKVEPGGERTPDIGSGLLPGSSVFTGKDGYAELIFPDGTFVTLGSNSSFTVKEIGQGNCSLTELKGALHILAEKGKSLLVKKHRFEAQWYSFVLGVRGTEFDLRVDERGQGILAVLQGEVELSNRDTGQQTTVRAAQRVEFNASGAIGQPESVDPARVQRWWEEIPAAEAGKISP